jgi:hypothetical protein
MDSTLQGIKDELTNGVLIAITKYKQTNDLQYIDFAIEGLQNILHTTAGYEKPGLTEFNAFTHGMLDELQAIISSHENIAPYECENIPPYS